MDTGPGQGLPTATPKVHGEGSDPRPHCSQERGKWRHADIDAIGQCTKSLRFSPLRGSKSRETGSRLRGS
jgi:hypothetical protein